MIAQRQKNKPNPQIEAVPRGAAPPAPPQLVVSVSRTDQTPSASPAWFRKLERTSLTCSFTPT